MRDRVWNIASMCTITFSETEKVIIKTKRIREKIRPKKNNMHIYPLKREV